MDHDNCDVIIKVLSNVLSRLIDVNKSHVGKQLITKFQSSYPPEVSIHAYLERIKKYAGCSDSCFVVALIYIDRMIEIRNVVLTSLNVHRLIITSLMLAAKFFDDYFYNNAFYAKLGGVAPMEMNSLELEFLQLLNFSLFVSPEVYLKYHAELRNYVGVVNIPVYLASFPNSPTSEKTLKGNSFLSRPPSTSPFLPLVEMARFPTPPLLDPEFDPTQNAQKYYHRILESNSVVPQVSPYESHAPLLQRTFITSSLPPCDEPGTAQYGYIAPSIGGPDQITGRGQPFGPYCVVPLSNQYYPNSNQVRHTQGHYAYQKAFHVGDLSSGQYVQTPLQGSDRDPGPDQNYHFKRPDKYELYNRSGSSKANTNCLQQGPDPLTYSHDTFQMMSNATASKTHSALPTELDLKNEKNEEFYRSVGPGVQKDMISQALYYSAPFPGRPRSTSRDSRCSRSDCQPPGLSPLDFHRVSVSPSSESCRDSGRYYPAQHQKGEHIGHSPRDHYYLRTNEAPSLSSFSDEYCESGVTTPASERSTCSSSGMTSRSSMLSMPVEGPHLNSSSVSSQIFCPQPAGSYYSQQQFQQPHYIIAS